MVISMIIGISGYATAGKDTIGEILVENHGFRRIAFADKLREVLLALNPIVDLDGDTAQARSTFCVVQKTDTVPLQPIVVGRYADSFARDDAGWHFTERVADVQMVGDVSDHLYIAL